MGTIPAGLGTAIPAMYSCTGGITAPATIDMAMAATAITAGTVITAGTAITVATVTTDPRPG